MNRIHVFGATSTILSLMIFSKAFLERQGIFFATLIQLTQSNINLMILLGMTFYYVILTGKLIQRLWFGKLRALEVEYALLASIMLGNAAKYVLHTIDLNSEAPWEEKSIYFFYIDLLLDFFKLAAYIVFFAVVVSHYGIPLHIVRDVYITLRSFLQRVRDLIRYKQATRNMNERYPTATAEELGQTDGVCIVCREEMRLPVEGLNPTPLQETPKKLPCGHLFHFRCLRSWLERQQSCPTCRQSVLDNTPNTNQPLNVNGPNQGVQPAPQQRNEPAPAQANVQPPRLPIVDEQIPREEPRRLLFTNLFRHEIPFELRFPRQAAVQQPESSRATALPKVYPVHLTPLGPVPPSFNGEDFELLSDEQLRQFEGTSRQAIIKRLEYLRNIQNQLAKVSGQLAQLAELMPDDTQV
ncbi:E3 ubiquitin-protein ligase hrd1 [Boothiomyces sp. JEL0838]|nr:E3 ubiquitin-protein ligase hrd1 [Boothiomyces sp. JEL0838]